MNRQSLINCISDTFSVEPDYPWFNTPDAAVFRHVDSRKWFGLLMGVSPHAFRIPGDAFIDILNVKCDPLMIGSLRQRPGFLPAYHMNKEQWVSIILNDVSDEEIMRLVAISYDLTQQTKGRSPVRWPDTFTRDWKLHTTLNPDELERALRLALSLASVDDRGAQCILLHYVEGMSYREIGEMYGRTGTTITHYIRKAQRQMSRADIHSLLETGDIDRPADGDDIKALGLSAVTIAMLRRAGINTVGELFAVESLPELPGIGIGRHHEINGKMKAWGYEI